MNKRAAMAVVLVTVLNRAACYYGPVFLNNVTQTADRIANGLASILMGAFPKYEIILLSEIPR